MMGKSLGWQYNQREQQEREGRKVQEVLDELSRISVEAKQWLKGIQLSEAAGDSLMEKHNISLSR